MNFRVIFNPTKRKLLVRFQELAREVPIRVDRSDRRFLVKFGTVYTATIRDNVEYYAGEYEVTPKIDSQTIPTSDKFLKDDVTVNAIPFFNVSNPAGGNTIYIGNEV